MERSHTHPPPRAIDAPTALAGTPSATDAPRPGVRLIRRLALVNLGLVALQALSAGFLLSGSGRAITTHAVVALALQLGALVQAVSAIVMWRRRRAPSWVAGVSLGLFVLVLLQVGLGYRKQYWLHVPIGVGLFGGLVRQTGRLDGLSNDV